MKFGRNSAAETPLEPGEVILRQAEVSDHQILRNLGIGVGFVTVTLIAVQLTGDGIDWRLTLLIVVGFIAVVSLYSLIAERGNRWILTDRRLLGPGNLSLPLSTDLKLREYFWGIVIRQSLLKSVRIRSIEDKSGFAAAIRATMLDSTARELRK